PVEMREQRGSVDVAVERGAEQAQAGAEIEEDRLLVLGFEHDARRMPAVALVVGSATGRGAPNAEERDCDAPRHGAEDTQACLHGNSARMRRGRTVSQRLRIARIALASCPCRSRRNPPPCNRPRRARAPATATASSA